MSRYYDDDETKKSVEDFQARIIEKMAEIIAEYIEMRKAHPEFKAPMFLTWDNKYKVEVSE